MKRGFPRPVVTKTLAVPPALAEQLERLSAEIEDACREHLSPRCRFGAIILYERDEFEFSSRLFPRARLTASAVRFLLEATLQGIPHADEN
jgi:hypothetical protein